MSAAQKHIQNTIPDILTHKKFPTDDDVDINAPRLMAEILKYAEDGSNIMIEHGWMEQPPQADDRKELAKVY